MCLSASFSSSAICDSMELCGCKSRVKEDSVSKMTSSTISGKGLSFTTCSRNSSSSSSSSSKLKHCWSPIMWMLSLMDWSEVEKRVWDSSLTSKLSRLSSSVSYMTCNACSLFSSLWNRASSQKSKAECSAQLVSVWKSQSSTYWSNLGESLTKEMSSTMHIGLSDCFSSNWSTHLFSDLWHARLTGERLEKLWLCEDSEAVCMFISWSISSSVKKGGIFLSPQQSSFSWEIWFKGWMSFWASPMRDDESSLMSLERSCGFSFISCLFSSSTNSLWCWG